MSKIKDVTLAKQGRLSYEWARTHMSILVDTVQHLKKSKPFTGVTLGFSLQLTKETAVLLVGSQQLGARVVASSGNPLTTQDDIAAFLHSQGIAVYAWSDQTQKEFRWCTRRVLKERPDIIVDDGSGLCVLAHNDPQFADLRIMGGTEETTTGVTRVNALYDSGRLRHPVIAVNDAYTKHLFDNRYGTGQSTIDGYLRAMNLLFAAKRVVVAGYGWVGKGVASRCRGMGAKVIVTETSPIKALEAHMDGYTVQPMMAAARVGDIFITCSGMTGVITSKHLESMKDGAIVGNVGHFNVEIDAKFLLTRSRSVRRVRPNLDECTLDNNNNNKKIFLISQGRVANLIAAQGHPPEVMALSFSNQLLSILYILKNHKKLPNKVLPVPGNVDVQISKNALQSMGVEIDHLTPEQIKYANSW